MKLTPNSRRSCGTCVERFDTVISVKGRSILDAFSKFGRGQLITGSFVSPNDLDGYSACITYIRARWTGGADV